MPGSLAPHWADGQLTERPADVLKVWPAREPIQRLPPAQFNSLLDQFVSYAADKQGTPPIAEVMVEPSSVHRRDLQLTGPYLIAAQIERRLPVLSTFLGQEKPGNLSHPTLETGNAW